MMIPTPELVEQLRNLAGEKEEGRFTDAELEDIIKASDNIYAAASYVWTLKAARIQEELGNIQSYSIGAESYTYRSLTDMLELCLKMADLYSQMGDMGARIVQVNPPDVV